MTFLLPETQEVRYDMEKIKPCPFCGVEKVNVETEFGLEAIV